MNATQIEAALAILSSDAMYGDRKVFLYSLYEAISYNERLVGCAPMSWEVFALAIVQANRQRICTLARLDYTEGLSEQQLTLKDASLINDLGSDFHCIVVE